MDETPNSGSWRGTAERGRGEGRYHHRHGRPDDRSVRHLRRPDEARRGARGGDDQRQGRAAGPATEARDRRRCLRSQAGRLRRQRSGASQGDLRRRPLLLEILDPGLLGLQRSRHPADHAGLDQSGADRRGGQEGLDQHLPHLRPGRQAGRGRRQLHRPALRRQAHRHLARQERLRQRPGRRDQEAAERQRGSPRRSTRPIRPARRTTRRWSPA
jgi:hypothetical protein